VILSDGQVVTARYGELPQQTEAAAGEAADIPAAHHAGRERDERKPMKPQIGGLLEVVDTLSGVVKEVSALPPRELGVELEQLDDESERQQRCGFVNSTSMLLPKPL